MGDRKIPFCSKQSKDIEEKSSGFINTIFIGLIATKTHTGERIFILAHLFTAVALCRGNCNVRAHTLNIYYDSMVK